jgi:predicted transcriptional regulator
LETPIQAFNQDVDAEMTTLTIRIRTLEDHAARFAKLDRIVKEGRDIPDAVPSLSFPDSEQMHHVLAPARLAIIKALAGQGVLSIREVARRVGRDVQAVHRDVTRLINAGVIDRNEKGVEFPYERIHFDFDVQAAA